VIRPATDQEWPLIYPFYAAIMAAPASFDHPEHGLVGLHIMFRPS
jgi:hypothetical protein